MKLVIQRVSSANVISDGVPTGEIGAGLVVLFCACEGDTLDDCALLARKTAELRIFEDCAGKMNLSALELSLSVLAVPNFTLAAHTKKGRRPDFLDAATPEFASPAFDRYVECLRAYGLSVATGVFHSDMKLTLTNDGPVTIIMDTREWNK